MNDFDLLLYAVITVLYCLSLLNLHNEGTKLVKSISKINKPTNAKKRRGK